MNEYRPVVYKKFPFFSTIVLGISAFLITCVVSGTVLLVYGIHVASDKTEDLFSLAEKTVQALPDLQKALPPAVADLLNDRREPSYAHFLDIQAHLEASSGREDNFRTVFEIENKGEEMVTLLTLRATVLNARNQIVYESNVWAATPFAADHEWKGPLMPRSHRRLAGSFCQRHSSFDLQDLRTEVEITDIRLWNGPKKPSAETEVLTAKVM
ncbi:MAG: hypothetical protein JXA82_16880 [Sedimentisphaerales bacterium]|nr:hypothetical protein [Sedimentisphaerales bacterium]